MFEATINLSDAIQDADSHIDQIRDAYHDLKEYVEDEYDGNWEAAPDYVVQRKQQYKTEWKETEGLKNVVDKSLTRWNGPTKENGTWRGDEFTIKMLSGAELAQIEDQVEASRRAIEQEAGVLPRDMSGSRMLNTLEHTVVDVPDGAPEDPDDWTHHIIRWVFQQVNNLNNAGTTDFSDSDGAFEDAMERS